MGYANRCLRVLVAGGIAVFETYCRWTLEVNTVSVYVNALVSLNTAR